MSEEPIEAPPPIRVIPVENAGPVLPYESGRDRVEQGEATPWNYVLFNFGCLGSFVFTIVIVLGFISSQYSGQRFTSVIARFLLAGLIGLHVRNQFKLAGWMTRRWFAMGALIGAGIALLLEGICFSIFH